MLSVSNLTKIYKTKGGQDTRALDNVTLNFPETGLVFLLGKSGSGKSTLLNLIGGLDYPTSGEITLKGRSSKNFKQSDFDSYRNTYVGFVFQEYNILNEFNVEQNIALAMELQNKKVKKEEVDTLLEQVDMKDFAKRKPNTLSGGQKQRIAIARALIKSPKIILADEPTGALDSKTGEQIFDTLKKLAKDKLVIVVSHDRDFAETYGDRIIELKDGQVLSDETKFHKEPIKISENVSVVNNEAITIQDASKLTKTEFDKLYEQIKKSTGKVYISSGTNAQKSLRATRISDKGSSEEFKQTKDIELKQYDGKQTKFIKSKMPMNKSVKMGLSSLKTKPFTLILTILLAVISFTLFGVVSSLMLYNPSYTYSEALAKSDYTAEALEKTIDSKQKYKSYENGQLKYENTYDYQYQGQFAPSEIETLNNNSLGMKFIGAMSSNYGESYLLTSNIQLTKYQDYYKNFTIRLISDCGEQGLQKLGFSISGTYPTQKDEVLLPMCFYDLIKDNFTGINSVNDAIGKKVNFSIKSYSREMKITGFVSVDSIPSTYDSLKDSTNLSAQQRDELSKAMKKYIENSFCCVAFASSELVDELADGFQSNASYINPYRRNGMRLTIYYYGESDEVISTNESVNVYTYEIYEQNKSRLIPYKLDGTQMTEQELAQVNANTKQALLGEGDYLNSISNNLWNVRNVLDEITDTYYSQYMPHANAYVTAHRDDLYDTLEKGNIYDVSIYKNLKDMVLNNCKEEYNKFKNILDSYWAFTSTNYYNYILTDEQRTLFQKLYNRESLTTSEYNTIHQIMSENFDTNCPNYYLLNYFSSMFDTENLYIQMITSDPVLNTIYQQYNSSENKYFELTEFQIQKLKEFLEEHYTIHNPDKKLIGYTFATREPLGEALFAPKTRLYYKSYNGTSGYFDVVGYLKGKGDTCYYPLVNKSVIEQLTLPPEYDYQSEIITDYVADPNERYTNVFVKTNYSIEQINLMTKKGTGYHLELTNDIYVNASQIARLIDNLKTIFLWLGVGLGTAAALMLLYFITSSISSKKREIGILRAIGARKIDVFKIFFSESLFISLLCFVLASVASFVVEMILNNSFVEDIGIKVLSFGLINIGLILGISLVITLIATIIPVWHSSRKPPVESIRAL